MTSGADSYFANRLWSSEWDNADGTTKNKALKTAQNQIDAIDYVKDFETEEYKKSIYEQALFLLNLDEEDIKRLSLQSQGVKSVRVDKISENYNINGLPLCSYVRELIKKYKLQPGELI